MPSNKLPQQIAGDLLAEAFHAARRSPVRVTFGQLERAGAIAPDEGAKHGIPCSVLIRALENGCVVWGPYLPGDGEPYYIIERGK